jgi:hypothetical protein
MISGAETAHLVPRPTAIFLEGRLPVLETKAVQSLGLHDGQVVRPTVEVRGEQLRLVLKGAGLERLLDLPAQPRMVPGESLPLRVHLLPNGQAQLRPLGPENTTGSASAHAAVAAQTQQASAGLSRLDRLAFRPPGMDAFLQLMRPGFLQVLLQACPQPEASEWVQRLLRQRPSMSQLTPEALRQAVMRSGLMTESLLARGLIPDGGDTKLLLRQLQRSWTQAPANVQALIENAIDDLESGQVKAVQAGQGGVAPGVAAEAAAGRELAFAFVLPFTDADPVSLRILRQRRRPGEEAPPLVVHLHSRSRDLGEIWLQTRLLQSQVDMTMWAVREDVARRADLGRGDLAVALDDMGLQMTRLVVIHGARTPEATPDVPPQAGSLVDFKA